MPHCRRPSATGPAWSSISTIIGFGGGGGIGYYLSEQINSMVGYNRAATGIWAIVLVVWVLDFLSAEVRKKLE